MLNYRLRLPGTVSSYRQAPTEGFMPRLSLMSDGLDYLMLVNRPQYTDETARRLVLGVLSHHNPIFTDG